MERVVPTPTSDDVWAAMVSELRDRYDTPGIAGQVGSVREWTPGDDSKVRVTLEPQGNMTRISVSRSLKDAAMMPPAISGIPVGIASIALVQGLTNTATIQDPFFVAALCAAIALVLFLGSRFVYGAYAQKQERKLEGALDRLETIALRDREPAPPDAASEGDQMSTDPALGDTLLDEDHAAPSAAERRRRTHS